MLCALSKNINYIEHVNCLPVNKSRKVFTNLLYLSKTNGAS